MVIAATPFDLRWRPVFGLIGLSAAKAGVPKLAFLVH
jgi:hypothetical protein